MLPTVALTLTTYPTKTVCCGACGFVSVYAPATVGESQSAVPPVNPIVFRLLTIPNVQTNPSAPEAIVSVTTPKTVTE